MRNRSRKRAVKEAEIPPILDVPTEAGLDEIEQHARVFRLVDGLPTDQRRVIEMRFAEEKSIRDIALELGRTEAPLSSFSSRALQNLRARRR